MSGELWVRIVLVSIACASTGHWLQSRSVLSWWQHAFIRLPDSRPLIRPPSCLAPHPLAAMGSNLTFQSRNVLSKKFMTKGEAGMNKV